MEAIETIRRAFQHETWARERLLAETSRLANDEFTRSLGVLDSLASRFTHIVDIDVLWMRRIYDRESPSALPARDRFRDIGEFGRYCQEVTRARNEALEGLRPDDLEEVVEFRDTRGQPYRETVGDMLLQVVLHAAHHRGQVTLCLKALGRRPGDVDYYIWAGKE